MHAVSTKRPSVPIWLIVGGGLVLFGVIIDMSAAGSLQNAGNPFGGMIAPNPPPQQVPAPRTTRSADEMPGLRGTRQVEEAKWVEAMGVAQQIALHLEAYHMQKGGFDGVRTGPASSQATTLELDPSLFRSLRYFSATDFVITSLQANRGGRPSFRITVTGSLPPSPEGSMVWDSSGGWRRP